MASGSGRQRGVLGTWENLYLLQQMAAVKPWGPQNQILFFQEKPKLAALEKFAHFQTLVIDSKSLKML